MKILSSLTSRLQAFRKDETGVSAMEFALILPVMCLLAIASWEATNAIMAKRKATHVATTLANLATQDNSISASDWVTFQDVADKILFPYNGFTRRLGMVGLEVDSSGEVNIACQFGSLSILTSALSDGLKVPNTFYIMTSIEVDYESVTAGSSFYKGGGGIANMTFSDSSVYSPRNGGSIDCD